MNNQRIGKQLFDRRKIQKVQRSRFGPTFHSLLAADGFHQNAQEIAGVAAFFQNPWFDFFPRQTGAVEQFASQPVIQKLAAVFELGKVPETQANQIEGVALGVVDGKASGRKKSVVKHLGARASAAQHEHWSLRACAAS